jgi:hypothetical protein
MMATESDGVTKNLRKQDKLLSHHLSQKFKLIERNKFNHLINTLTLRFTCELKLSFNK